jgi:Holliday junction resolvase-like predicted endonuclease
LKEAAWKQTEEKEILATNYVVNVGESDIVSKIIQMEFSLLKGKRQ